MRVAPVMKSFVQAVSTRERHPLDDEFFILSNVRPEGRVVGRLEHFPPKWMPVRRRKCDQHSESRA